ncbi:MAG: hypothetical protein ACOCXQ_01035 [Patescibacteria group bacterium]
MTIFVWLFIISLVGVGIGYWKKKPRPKMGLWQIKPEPDPWEFFYVASLFVVVISSVCYVVTIDLASKSRSIDIATRYVMSEENVNEEDIEVHVSGCQSTKKISKRNSYCYTWRGYVEIRIESGEIIRKEMLMSQSDAGYIGSDSLELGTPVPEETRKPLESSTSSVPTIDTSRDPALEYVIPPEMLQDTGD